MTEDEARGWIEEHHGPAGVDAMTQVVAIVSAATATQNLVSPSTIATMWNRHIVDSAQLLTFSDAANESDLWIDIGSGAGFPGLVVAALSKRHVWLVEPRKRRAEFLSDAGASLGLASRVRVIADKVETVVNRSTATVSARAVAPLAMLFGWTRQCAGGDTRWIVPKGRTAREDVVTARKTWHGTFHVEHSITDPDSLIVLASGVIRR